MIRDFLQVFFTIITAVFSLGQAAPHFQAMSEARGAAYTLWEIIDTVSKTTLNVSNMHIIVFTISLAICYLHQ